jgi:hypothetical protein
MAMRRWRDRDLKSRTGGLPLPGKVRNMVAEARGKVRAEQQLWPYLVRKDGSRLVLRMEYGKYRTSNAERPTSKGAISNRKFQISKENAEWRHAIEWKSRAGGGRAMRKPIQTDTAGPIERVCIGLAGLEKGKKSVCVGLGGKNIGRGEGSADAI